PIADHVPIRTNSSSSEARTNTEKTRWASLDSNQGPTDYESAALTAELLARWRRTVAARVLLGDRLDRGAQGRDLGGHLAQPGAVDDDRVDGLGRDDARAAAPARRGRVSRA